MQSPSLSLTCLVESFEAFDFKLINAEEMVTIRSFSRNRGGLHCGLYVSRSHLSPLMMIVEAESPDEIAGSFSLHFPVV